MDAKLRNLRLLLERMNVLYERLLGILQREKNALVLMDFESLLAETREKDEVVAALKALDRDRLRIQDQFAIVMDRDPATLTLRDLAEALIEQGASARDMGIVLMDLRSRMNHTVEQLRDRIRVNNNFIEKSISHLQGIAAHVSQAISGARNRGAGKAAGVYTGKAKVQEGPGQTGTILERRF